MTMFCGIRHGTERSNSTEHNIHKVLVTDLVTRSVPRPTPAKWGLRPNISPIRKPWEVPVVGRLHVNAPQPAALQSFGFLSGQHGVVAVSVTVEDRVVEPLHAPMVAGEST